MATGLINLSPKKDEVASYTATQAKAVTPTTVGYKPNEFTVSPNATVSGQLDKLADSNSPLLLQARRRAELKANQAMNDRGLINSSLAVGAATEASDAAFYDRAIPIAQQDAQTYGTANTNTTNAQNAALYAKMQADNQASLQDSQQKTNVSLANADAQTKADATASTAANQFKQTGLETDRALTLSDKDTERSLAMANLDAQTRVTLAGMDRDTQAQLATINNNYRQLLQLNQDAASMYTQASTNIANISLSNLSREAKDSAIATQLNTLREALRAKQAVTGTPATGTVAPPNVQALNLSSYFQQSEPTFHEQDYNIALDKWNKYQADHMAKYGIPIPESAYKDGYRPPDKQDFYR